MNLDQAKAKWDAMTKEERQAMIEAQRQSWVRGEMAMERMSSPLAMPGLFADVGEFHKRFGLDIYPNVKPQLLLKDVQAFRFHFLKEELQEFATAYMDGDIEKAGDALVDLVYVALGTAHLMGLPFDEMWAEVHRANMRKERALSAEDSRSTRRHSLDVVKPAGWRPPDHAPIIERARQRFPRS